MANEQMNILITGSAGFLGAPLAFDLLNMGYKIIGVDNYSNSNSQNTDKLKKNFNKDFKFYELDISLNPKELNKVFLKHRPALVIHLAALKSVQESIMYPDIYIKNNIQSTINILNSMKLHDCQKIIYSSSAAVYGNQNIQPINESVDLKPESTYAETKITCEKLINDACKTDGVNGISLRYFNPIGFHSSKLFRDELNESIGSIMQEIIKVALKKNKFLNIFGNNYPTKDGTCERDFIHIDDILDAHIKSIDYIHSFRGYDVFNIGTGQPVSILKLIITFIEQNKTPIEYKFTNKKSGDVKSSYADVSKIKTIIGWSSKKDLNAMVKDSWKAYTKENI